MSSITVPKTRARGCEAASPRLESPVMPMLPAITPVQRRTAKKARPTTHLVESVQEVVQAFEFEYAQVRAESVELKAVLDERRTQLSDLRRHLEKESAKNGALEAEVQARDARNRRGAARLRELESAFDQALRDERLIESRAAALETDLAVFAAEHREAQEKIGLAAARLDRAEGALERRENALAETRRESDRLDACVQDWRRVVAERDAALRGEQERASRSAELAREAGEEASSLEAEVNELRRELARKEVESAGAAAALGVVKQRAAETMAKIADAKADRARVLRAVQDRAEEVKRQIAAKEQANREFDESVEAAEAALAADRAAQDAERAEIAATRAGRKDAVDGEVRRLSEQVEAVDDEIVKAEEAVARASERTRQANAEFSSLMSAMSVAFREYDQAVTANRELEKGAAETGSSLEALEGQSRRDVLLLRQRRDALRESNAEMREAVEADRRRAGELDAILGDTQRAVETAAADVAAKRPLATACEGRLEEGRERISASEESKKRQRQAGREAREAAEARLEASKARLRQRQSELIDSDAQAGAWTPPPATLDDSDLRRVEQEAAAVVERSGVDGGGDEAHLARVAGLRETLATIVEGGESRLKVEREAAAARVANLQEKIRQASRSLAALRARGEAAKKMEAALILETGRREAEQRRVADEARAAAAAAAAAAQATQAAAAAARAAAVEAAEAEAVAQAKAAARAAAADQAAPADEAAAAATAADQASADQAAADRAAATARAGLYGFSTPDVRSPGRSSALGHRPPPPYRRAPARSYAPASSRGSAPTGSRGSSFVTPDVRPASRSTAQGPARGGAAPGPGRGPGAGAVGTAGGRSQPRSPDARESSKVNTHAEPATHHHRSRTDRQPSDPPRRPKKPSRSLSKDPPTRGQQASESTAEAAGSRKSASSGRKNSGGSGGGDSGRHKKKDKPSSSSSSSAGSSHRGGSGRDRGRRVDSDDRRRSSDGGRGGGGGGGGASGSRKGSSTSKSRSPRHRPRSPRPASKARTPEYDLWTDNTLVGDSSDFSFF